MFGLSTTELLIIGIVAVLLFGSRLPSVARSLGKSMTEFKKGLHGIEDEVKSASDRPNRTQSYIPPEDRAEATAPKFVPPATDTAGTTPAEDKVGA